MSYNQLSRQLQTTHISPQYQSMYGQPKYNTRPQVQPSGYTPGSAIQSHQVNLLGQKFGQMSLGRGGRKSRRNKLRKNKSRNNKSRKNKTRRHH
uniref:Uncharacterized protein n=1 Tax=viral metagenome TaxID=1070528 RepID=A0A6C0KRU6_9ZZZZ